MYDYIKGTLISKQSTKESTIIVECGNIGYAINTTQRTINLAGEENTSIKIYTTLIHKEDTMTLCGFLNKEDRDIFNILMSVSGVGMKVALVLLDEFSGYDLISAVIRGDHKELSRAKGVGPKMAQKIILELKDKLINWQKNTPIEMSDITNIQKQSENISNECITEVQAVLLSLGYSPAETQKSIKLALNTVEKIDCSEEILKEALKYLSQN